MTGPILSQIPQPLPEDDRIFTKKAVRLSLVVSIPILLVILSFKAGEYYGRKEVDTRVPICDAASQYDIYNKDACKTP